MGRKMGGVGHGWLGLDGGMVAGVGVTEEHDRGGGKSRNYVLWPSYTTAITGSHATLGTRPSCTKS